MRHTTETPETTAHAGLSEAPPAGYVARPPTMADVPDAHRVIVACEVADYGVSEMSEADVRDGWRRIDLEHDARVVVDGDGQIAGVADYRAGDAAHLDGHVFTHPEHKGRGIGTWLTRWAEARGRELVERAPAEVRVTLGFVAPTVNEAALALLANEGYAPLRNFLRMAIEMDAPPPAPAWPDGLRVRAFVAGADGYAVYRAIEEAFADHWNRTPRSYEDWRADSLEGESVDTTHWFLAVGGNEIAGVSLCREESGQGFINTLGVRRPWRRTGAGLALLRHSFGEFYRRGSREVALGVDAQSLTGATRLYERGGMREVRRYALYSKELRAGKETGRQTLDE
jgi:mycothiol synthase